MTLVEGQLKLCGLLTLIQRKGIRKMAKLNEYNDQTKGKIHLMVTTLCDRDCKYCCNKQYDLDAIPTVTPEELAACHTVYISSC